MLTSGEAQLTGRELGTEKSLPFFLFGRPASFHIYTLSIRTPFAFVRFVHIDVLRFGRLYGSLRVPSTINARSRGP